MCARPWTAPRGLTSLVGADALTSFVACSGTTIVVGGANDTDNGIQSLWTSPDSINWTWQHFGSGVLTVTVAAGGAGYQVGDVLTLVDFGSNNHATVTVLSLNGNSPPGVATVTVTTPGAGYVVGHTYATTGGSGVGATVSVSTASAYR